MKRILYGTILLLFLIEMAFAVDYGNLSPRSGDNISPIDNVSPLSSLSARSAESIDIVEVVPADKDEYLVLLNTGKDDIVLMRWYLSVDGRLQMSLPRIDLLPDSRVVLHIGNGNESTKSEIYIGYSSPILEDAGNVSLMDETGNITIEKKYP